MTDLEGVAGVQNAVDWVHPESRFYGTARRFLTLETNAAVEGFFAGGADYVLVADGHGPGAIDLELLDPRVEYARGWPDGFPFGLDQSFDGLAWVGQHAKASSEFAHLCHTQSFQYVDLSVNDLSIGELGQMALCGAELGVPAFFASGDLALAKEAEALVPGIVACWVKRGVRAGTGEDCTVHEYERRNEGAVHLAPASACRKIREAAEAAVVQLRKKAPPMLPLVPPFRRVATFRPADKGAPKTVSREEHASSVIALLNVPFAPVPAE